MIIDIWKPRKINGIRYYEMLDEKTTTYKGYKVRYICDNENCRNKETLNISTSSSLLSAKWNNFHKQMCRSCRSIKSEKNKGVTIPYDELKHILEYEGYTLLTNKYDYENCIYPSQFKISVVCKNGHKHTITWNNWIKGKRCRKCYKENQIKNSVKYLKGFDLYKRYVIINTYEEYKKYKNKINPKNYKRGHNSYHLDHKFSITEGFKNNIPPFIIGSHYNLEMLTYDNNIRKGCNCSITKEELFNEYFSKDK